METIDARALHERLERGDAIVLLDARRTEEYEREHLPGALGAMSDHIIEWAPSLVPDKDAEVVTYCRSVECRRRLRAAERLEGLGYANVTQFAGGVEEWVAAGYPLER
jgi:rhodanese-related sulfurtransferase